MKWVLILYFLNLGGAPQIATSIGPYDDQAGCTAIGKVAQQTGWKFQCLPVGAVTVKEPEPEKKTK